MPKLNRYYTKQDRALSWVFTGAVVFFVILVILPLMFVVSSAFSDPENIVKGRVFLLPVGPTLKNFAAVLENREIWIGYRNSIIYAAVSTTFSVLVTVMVAYPLSKHDFSLRKPITILFLITMFFYGGIIPTYLTVQKLGFVNTVWPMIFMPPTSAAGGAISVFNIIIVRTYIKNSIHRDIFDSAKIDGCDEFTITFRFIFALAKPVIAVISLFYVVRVWNEFFVALLFIAKNRSLLPLQIFLREVLIADQMEMMMDLVAGEGDYFYQQTIKREGMRFAVIIFGSLPMIILIPFIKKHFERGIMVGAIKG